MLSPSAAQSDTQVLVVGAGPVGLTLAITLGRLGIRCTLIERAERGGHLPKMDLTNPSSMEIFGRLGLAEKIREAGWPLDANLDVYAGPSLVEEPYKVLSYPSIREMQSQIARCADGSMPREPYERISQYNLEGLLRREAEAMENVAVCFGHELISFQEGADGVSAAVPPDAVFRAGTWSETQKNRRNVGETMKTTSKLSIALLAVAFTAVGASAQQASYPTRPITWVVPAGAGGGTDNSARFFAKVLSEKIGQPVVVDNKPGAGGIVGTEVAAQAKPDGYTMLYASQSPMATFPFLYKKLSYRPLKSFVPVNGMGDTSLLMVVNASAPYQTVEEFIAHLKKNPGKLNFGSVGAGTSTHLLGEMFQMATGTSMVHVPYRTPTNLYADLLSGTIDVIFDFTVIMRPHIEAGKLVALAISREDRLKSFPNVPTFKERGLDIVLTAWASIAMPAGTPPEIVNKMAAAMAETTRDPAIIKYFEENDFGNLGHLGPEKLKAFYISEAEKFKKVVEKANITLD